MLKAGLRDVRMLRGQRDVKAHNIPGQRDVKLNELAKQNLMLLPLLLLLLLLLYVLYHVCTRVPSCNARKRMKLPEGAAYKKHLRRTFE